MGRSVQSANAGGEFPGISRRIFTFTTRDVTVILLHVFFIVYGLTVWITVYNNSLVYL